MVEPVSAPCMGGVQDDGACKLGTAWAWPVCTTFGVNSPRHWRTMIEVLRVEERGTEPAGVPRLADVLGNAGQYFTVLNRAKL